MLHDGARAAVDLYWLPLGASDHSVRVNGIVSEAISSLMQRRPRCDLYHTALGVGPDTIAFPPRARAPGWDAGITVARRQLPSAQVATAA